MRRNDATDPADAPGPDALGDRETASGEPWVLRDEEFLSEADREYVVRDDGWPWLSSLSALAVGALVGLLVADVTAILAATASGRDALAFLPPAIAAVGLRGLLAAKVGVAAVLVVATTGTCSRRHRRAGALPDALVGVAGFIAVVGGVALV